MRVSHAGCRGLLFAAAVAALGCFGTPEEALITSTCVADPAAGRAEDRCGVFVSGSFGSDSNPGTRQQPVRSMEQAIAIASAGPLRVYACAEVFRESVVLPSGVELWGGLDCGNGWVHLPGDKRTILAPGPDAIPLRVDAATGKSRVADVRAEAADATKPGGSSIAVMVMPGARVEFLRSELMAGDGAPGAPGEDGGALPASGGTGGEPGDTACSAVAVLGGGATATLCGDFTSLGGQGGDGDLASGQPGLDGQPAPAPNPQGFGLGGLGQSNSLQCFSGMDGADGHTGDDGGGATGRGRISTGGWEGEKGQDGGDGLPGQGGGGGGSSRGGAFLCGSNQERGGAGGGSGGAGGCGGRGGRGGAQGGGSIGLLTLGAEVALHETSVTAGRGGDGGAGGLAQAGGVGGAGGPGGSGFNFADPGCHGGRGGKGGDGGSGGGGLGGPSIGIAHGASSPVAQEHVTIEVGSPGKGGLGGNPGAPGSAGEDGIAGALVPFPP